MKYKFVKYTHTPRIHVAETRKNKEIMASGGCIGRDAKAIRL